jgi:hypothetical protein
MCGAVTGGESKKGVIPKVETPSNETGGLALGVKVLCRVA